MCWDVAAEDALSGVTRSSPQLGTINVIIPMVGNVYYKGNLSCVGKYRETPCLGEPLLKESKDWK